jgi:hypothetical protein
LHRFRLTVLRHKHLPDLFGFIEILHEPVSRWIGVATRCTALDLFPGTRHCRLRLQHEGAPTNMSTRDSARNPTDTPRGKAPAGKRLPKG